MHPDQRYNVIFASVIVAGIVLLALIIAVSANIYDRNMRLIQLSAYEQCMRQIDTDHYRGTPQVCAGLDNTRPKK